MPYNPTTWVDKETPVNAENLNNLEQGVVGATERAEDTYTREETDARIDEKVAAAIGWLETAEW